jgi:hypothetical protein
MGRDKKKRSTTGLAEISRENNGDPTETLALLLLSSLSLFNESRGTKRKVCIGDGNRYSG